MDVAGDERDDPADASASLDDSADLGAAAGAGSAGAGAGPAGDGDDVFDGDGDSEDEKEQPPGPDEPQRLAYVRARSVQPLPLQCYALNCTQQN